MVCSPRCAVNRGGYLVTLCVMHHEMIALFIAFLLAGGIFGLIEAGRRIGARRLAAEGESYSKGVGALESAVFALLGLLLAFSFSGALTRFDMRRQMVVMEANCIGTAWLRIQLLREEDQEPMRQLVRRYLDARIRGYGALPDLAVFKAELENVAQLQGEIWSRAVPATAKASNPESTRTLFLNALNSMFDIVTTRTEAIRIHTPLVIFWMLGALALSCGLFAGYDMAMRKRRSLLHSVAFAVVLSITAYVIIDLEHPRLGLIQVLDSDRVLVDLRASMK